MALKQKKRPKRSLARVLVVMVNVFSRLFPFTSFPQTNEVKTNEFKPSPLLYTSAIRAALYLHWKDGWPPRYVKLCQNVDKLAMVSFPLASAPRASGSNADSKTPTVVIAALSCVSAGAKFKLFCTQSMTDGWSGHMILTDENLDCALEMCRTVEMCRLSTEKVARV